MGELGFNCTASLNRISNYDLCRKEKLGGRNCGGNDVQALNQEVEDFRKYCRKENPSIGNMSIREIIEHAHSKTTPEPALAPPKGLKIFGNF